MRVSRKVAGIGLLSLVTFLSGCTLFQRAEIEKTLKNDTHPASQPGDPAPSYLVASPDVLEVVVAGRSALSGSFPIGADGRIVLDHYGSLRVEGHKISDISHRLAEVYGVPAETVSVRVAEFRSQHLVLFGQVVGWQRVVPYQGQETVLELLHRSGGITKGAAPEKVFVVRPNIFEGKRPEIFHVDLAKIATQEDDTTNIRLLPYDQIYVGETRQARIERFMPKWARPFYQFFWDTRPEREALEKEAQQQNRLPWMVGNSAEPPAPPKTPRRLPHSKSFQPAPPLQSSGFAIVDP